MTNPWFRLYNEIIDNEKILMLNPDDRWHFIGVLTLKNRGVLDSEQDPDRRDRKVALKLRLSMEEARALRTRLAVEQLIDPESWQPLGWDERQYQSDSSKERTRAYRNRKTQESRSAKSNVDSQATIDTQKNDSTSVTSPERHGDNAVTVQETESETDTENTHTGKFKAPSPSVCVELDQRKNPRAGRRAKPLAPDWQPESWIDSERWQRWQSVLKARGQMLTQPQAELALASLRRCVFDLGWPMRDVMDKAIANGYRQFYPLNRRGEPEKNPSPVKRNRETLSRGIEHETHQQTLVAVQAELAHWQKFRSQTTSASSQTDIDQLIAAAENKLQRLRARHPESAAA